MTMSEEAGVILALDEVTCAYGPVVAARSLRINVRRGDVVTILGANGAGKSTTLKAISGLVRPVRGKVFFDGKDISHTAPWDRVKLGIAHCPEGRRVFSSQSVQQNLLLGAHLTKSKKDALAEADKILELFPALGSRLNQAAGSMSGGEQQMLAIGRAMMSKPKLLLLDEPSLGLAPVIIHRVFEALQKIKDLGTTIVLVEQNVSMALRLADYAYVLRQGRVDIEGTSAEVSATDAVRESYLGA